MHSSKVSQDVFLEMNTENMFSCPYLLSHIKKHLDLSSAKDTLTTVTTNNLYNEM